MTKDETKEDELETKERPDTDELHEAKDKPSREENIQAMPDTKNKGSTDQVHNETEKDTTKQDTEIDEQDTGEDKEGIGQAENEESQRGHKGVAEAKKTESKDEKSRTEQKQEKRKQGDADERRTLDDKQSQKKKLKTVDRVDEKPGEDKEDVDMEGDSSEAEEFQHVKEAQKTDKTTLDSATDEQSKQVQHQDDRDEDKENITPDEEVENPDQLPVAPEEEEPPKDGIDEVSSEKLGKNKDDKEKSRGNDETSEEKMETTEVEVEGDTVTTTDVARGIETTSHTAIDLLRDLSLAEEPSALETLEMRKMFENQLRIKETLPEVAHVEIWQQIANKMLPVSRELCEQLRLILEPTKRTRFKGDYRTGRRINMKKIIPYIASQFRKDKIWLRRTKPAQRDYKITIAVDDSKSMDHNNSRVLTLEAISLVSQALTLLESGKLSVVSFGEAPKIILNHNAQFDGAKLVQGLNFDENQTRIAELLDFIRIENQENAGGGDNNIFENLLLILSDGRNIFSEGEQKVRNAIKLARLQRIFIVYIIIDNPENKVWNIVSSSCCFKSLILIFYSIQFWIYASQYSQKTRRAFQCTRIWTCFRSRITSFVVI